ncbi:LysE family translocator [Chromobacterium haemolyticum]|uniref:LysE family translocator n=1 Tax=Chromobacterium fluminis TaxID=3044269 RepID=A0ABX0LHS2_9NEIS|nr:LysE family translocator [Chromobacterium haemolyticum]NHR08743.1 LysE family translocator [Chromobacterium haemolyticum]
MSSQILVMYLLSILVVIAVPGPLSLFMVATSAEHGLLRAWPAFAGGVLASLSLLLLSALGVGALILASPGLFSILQTLGAGYLLWLGFKAWRGAGQAAFAQHGRRGAPAQWFSHAFLLGISNPKDIAFFVALLPQFIDAHAPLAPQLGWMAAGWAVIDLSCKTAYGLLAQLFFQRLAVLRIVFLKASALFFLALGLALIWSRLTA